MSLGNQAYNDKAELNQINSRVDLDVYCLMESNYEDSPVKLPEFFSVNTSVLEDYI